MHARFYAPTMGRFLSVDPLIPTAAMRLPQLWNRYAYVANNPIKHVDPQGLILQLSACVSSTSSEECSAQFKLLLSTFGKNANVAAHYLHVGKNGIVSIRGISGSGFAAQFGLMGRATNYLISNNAATFRLVTGASQKTAESGGSYFDPAKMRTSTVPLEYELTGGGEIGVDLGAFPQIMGGIKQTTTGALVHEIGHAVGSLLQGIRDDLDARLGNSVWTQHEGYSLTFENHWRPEQGQDIRLFYHYCPKDVTLSDAPVYP